MKHTLIAALLVSIVSGSVFAQEEKSVSAFEKLITSIVGTKEERAQRKEERITKREKRRQEKSVFVAKSEDLSQSMMPKKYTKRNEPILNAVLVYYGDYYTESDLERVQNLLEDRFFLATDKMITLNTVSRKVIPFKHQISEYPDYVQEHVTDIERLQRLWYYDNVGPKVMKEVYEQVKSELKGVDVLLVVTGAQFDGLGFASGRVGITENPMEIAWGLPGGGRVEIQSDAKVVDELIHELGHTMFLDHTSNQCQRDGLSYKEKMECCEQSPAKNDVMSYCRNRRAVDENHFFGFEACQLRNLKDKVIPAMLNGGDWNVANRENCL